ncbi:cardiolipin synthase [Ruminococcus sp.]|uniref:cardiolipin synthase n=1 Tax=Ruminococcus sp. TaxID=41978 RepID=UPI0026343689|nr:cardiolipin synthase [Ruminococcus sp.]MDD7556490.1 cardiolipin synthase [Ruminococcus sp.]
MQVLKRIRDIITSRLFVTSFLILLQLTAMILPFLFLGMRSVYIHTFVGLISTLISLSIANDEKHAPFHAIWIIVLLAAPIAGWPLYVILRYNKQAGKASRRCATVSANLDKVPFGGFQPDTLYACKQHPFHREMLHLASSCNAPVFTGTTTRYFSNGESFYPVYLEELRKAKKFIFMEYFIINEGFLWQEIKQILAEKCRQGVEVRILYDDIATISKLTRSFRRELRSMGVQVYPFNPFRAAVDSFMNYRDHRKITVIDGVVGFTGGINLADEYINKIERFGYWKDAGLMLKGSAVQALTHTFLKSWGFVVKEEQNPQQYLIDMPQNADSLVQPFCDSPTGPIRVGRNTYTSLINGAQKYVWITAPYLILENEMLNALCLAATSGVDVRIITPHVADKWYVHAVTRSNYRALIKAGVKVYEYTPGFVHAKLIVTDDAAAMVATTNFDYRSFYALFENGVMLYGQDVISQIKTDFIDTMDKSLQYTMEMCQKTPRIRRAVRKMLRIFSPFL